MTPEAVRERAGVGQRRHIEHDLLLSALPHPILVLGDDDRVCSPASCPISRDSSCSCCSSAPWRR
jgi:hypothetical protein